MSNKCLSQMSLASTQFFMRLRGHRSEDELLSEDDFTSCRKFVPHLMITYDT